jgi:ADP-heptose:LPS heptosyltransferase
MLTTPLLAALGEAFPSSRFDWAVSDWALPAISSNPRVTRIIRTGPGDLAGNTREEMLAFLETARAEGYDTCFIPAQSGVLVRAAQRMRIPQRIDLDVGRRGHARPPAVQPPPGERRIASIYLSLAATVGVDESIIRAAEMEFHPPDVDRTAVARWLVEEVDWLGDTPLVVLHPGGGDNPAQTNLDKRWPTQRFARLANHLARTYRARLIVVGTAEERALVEHVAGMMSFPSSSRAGTIGLGELGALCELASLYVGNDAGSTYVAAATGCPTLAIYGPTDPAVFAPYMINGRVKALWRPYEGEFNWANGVSVEEAAGAADELLAIHSMPAGL